MKTFSTTKDQSKDAPKTQEISSLTLDFDILNIPPSSEVKNVYQAYKRYAIFYHPKVYLEKDRDYKFGPIKEAYLRIIKEKQRNISQLSDQDAKELIGLLKNNYGLLYEKTQTRAELIVDENDKERPWSEPRLINYYLLATWLSLGLYSIILDIFE